MACPRSGNGLPAVIATFLTEQAFKEGHSEYSNQEQAQNRLNDSLHHYPGPR
jgi:hypothetical protein